MPAIVRYKCDRCSFEQKGVESFVAVMTVDGEEKPCPHPCEKMIATRITGKSWQHLVRQNRIRVKCALLCLSCGHLDYYAMTRRSAAGGGFAHSIYYRPSLEEAASYACSSCKQQNLYPLCGPQEGCLQLILRAFRLVTPPPVQCLACPQCKVGRIAAEMVGKT